MSNKIYKATNIKDWEKELGRIPSTSLRMTIWPCRRFVRLNAREY